MEKSGRVLIVDDDNLVLEALNELLVDEYDVVPASSGDEAVDLAGREKNFDAVILDIKMAKTDGLQTAGALKEVSADLPVIFYTGYPGEYSEGQIDKKYHPFDYVVKSERPARLLRAVRNAVTFHQLKKQSGRLIENAHKLYGMVGKSQKMLDVYRTIEKIAATESKVMIVGPTGSGKELVALAIHKRSHRGTKRLAVLNCNHRQPDLVASELFGHVRGAFTGAFEDRIGMFEYADGGTLFLDEVSDLDITTQAKLLRVIETGQMQKLGSPHVRKVDVRIICATNRDLEKMVETEEFRADLYYRLKGVTITLPSLKDRREDISDLIDYFLERYASQKGEGIKLFGPAAQELMIEYDWPGNVRQLQHAVQSLIDLSVSFYITREDVENYLSYSGMETDSDQSLNAQLRDMKKLIITKTLVKTNNNVSAAARMLGMDRSNLSKTIKELGIKSG
ncbi:MAG: sigma-54-dependent Fis family transcriptional regulator [Candidatus Zixiibacteriota bacterium]|nr:MAG: sigma-54-dependent Fis family transcriptional regulator [candidate division Zixibacteria bacterium]